MKNLSYKRLYQNCFTGLVSQYKWVTTTVRSNTSVQKERITPINTYVVELSFFLNVGNTCLSSLLLYQLLLPPFRKKDHRTKYVCCGVILFLNGGSDTFYSSIIGNDFSPDCWENQRMYSECPILGIDHADFHCIEMSAISARWILRVALFFRNT